MGIPERALTEDEQIVLKGGGPAIEKAIRIALGAAEQLVPASP